MISLTGSIASILFLNQATVSSYEGPSVCAAVPTVPAISNPPNTIAARIRFIVFTPAGLFVHQCKRLERIDQTARLDRLKNQLQPFGIRRRVSLRYGSHNQNHACHARGK